MTEPRSPLIPTVGRILGPTTNGAVFAPLTVLLTGVVLSGLWKANRGAALLALAVGLISLAIYGFAGGSFLVAGSFASAFICAVVITAAALTTSFAFKTWREMALPASRPAQAP